MYRYVWIEERHGRATLYTLHQAGGEFEPKVLRPTRDSADLGFSATDAIEAGVATINR